MKKSKAKLPDTNTILRDLLRDQEELYGKAAAVFEDVRTGAETAIILESVLVECVYILTRFLGYKGIVNQDLRELTESLAMFVDSTIDIVDCLLFVKARNYGLSLFAFDKKLAAKEKQPAE
jgi:predicted nucleic-acid-binding protein